MAPRLVGPQGDWSPAELEAAGTELLKYLRSHFEQVDDIPVTTTISARELLALLDTPIPEQPEAFDTILSDTREKVVPHLTHWNHPDFFAYFAISASGAGILADTLVSALNVQGMLWKTGPAASALEAVVLRWMAELIGYDPQAEGVLVNGASLATFYALAAAREETGLQIRELGMAGRDLPTLRLYCSEQAHSSVDKAAIALGIGLENLVKVGTDAQYRMAPEQLEAAIRADVEQGRRPFAVVALAGTTSTGAVDPLDAIGEICRRYGVWLHIDGAFGGLFNLVPAVRAQVPDFGPADSVVVNPHKVLYTPLEATALYCRRKGRLAEAFSLDMVPAYLRTPPDEGSVNFMDYSLQLGRSFRALKLWWVIRTFGRQGLQSRMAEHLRLARLLAANVAAHPDLQLVGDSPYPLVCFRFAPAEWQREADTAAPGRRAALQAETDRLSAALLALVNAGGHRYISNTLLREGYTLRVSIGNIRTEERHVVALWESIAAGAASLRKSLQGGADCV